MDTDLPDLPDLPDYVARGTLHGQRPTPGKAAYRRAKIGDFTVTADFDAGVVGFSVHDFECPVEVRLAGVLMSLTAQDAFVLAQELELAARIADPKLGVLADDLWTEADEVPR